MRGPLYCARCGAVFPNVDTAWAHYHPWEVPAQAAAIQVRHALVMLVTGLLPPPTRGAAE